MKTLICSSKSTLVLFLIVCLGFQGVSQDMTPYIIYNAKGKKVSYKKMLKQLEKQDVIFFGEQHNNPIAHWLQYEVTRALHNKRDLILGAEMIEADNQEALDNYLKGTIDQKAFDTLARLWKNYPTDYAPLVDFAKQHELKFIGTNIPRRYANQVYKNGFEVLESLTPTEKSWIASLPIPFDPELPRYVNILSMMGDHGTPNLVKSQASKDATMAHFIAKNHSDGELFIHYNGAYHSDFFEGILWYLNKLKPEYRVITISTVEQADISKLSKDHFGQADFIICVDSHMTKTY
ncbi:ChaN family lipoprotein [Roseivirga misakiensis]|uniref:Iron-regulated protein n=1 Tax=Roseivirga misakiensis TaxID=1563681 RepID=A0A1E5SKU8_9BACT|nr:ChaN family lipoprotein [Roseivirga misakiensis]OEJ99758.1 iron-regulated protein [Roseivirga misakiensis]